MVIKRKYVFILFCFFLLSPSFAQYPFIQKIVISVPGQEPVFSKAIQDTMGYLWFGSQEGLFRFDGSNYKQFYPGSDSAEFNVTALHEAADGIIWVGCRNGSIYQVANGIVSRFDPATGVSDAAVSDIIVDNDGMLWWSTNGEGIFLYDGGRVLTINNEAGLNDDYVYDLEYDHEGKVWAATDGGLASCSFIDGQKEVMSLNKNIRLTDIIVRVIKEDQAGNLWLGFQDGGAGYLLPDRNGFKAVEPDKIWQYGPVTDIVILGSVAWIAGEQGAVVESSACKENVTARVQYNSLESGKVYDLLEDHEGNVWVITHTGIYRSSGSRLKFLSKVGERSIGNIHAIRNDHFKPEQIWFSNDEGLFSLNLTNENTKRFLQDFMKPDLKIMCLYQDQYGYIWAGTFNYGVFRINADDGSWIRINEEKGLINNNVLSISGHNDTLWMATLGGASEIILNKDHTGEPFRISSHNRENGLVSNYIYSVYEDQHDQIWFATDGDGVIVKTKTGWMLYDEENGLGDDVIYSITGDKFGNIWIATSTHGIYKFTDGNFNQIGTSQGLSSLEIAAISAMDDELVIVHEDGLDVLQISTGKMSHYGAANGLSEITPDLNVVSKDKEGNLWIGTRMGLVRYQPGIESANYGPITVLEEMLVFLEPRTMTEGQILNNNENHVSFRYTGIWFTDPDKIAYQVFLEGYDLGWKETYDRLVTYSNLPEGDYTFKVRSSPDQSFRNASESSYHFRINGPFWLNAWFIVSLLLLLAAMAYSLIRYRENKLRMIEQEKKEKIEFEFQVLKNQVNPHFLFNSFSTLMSLIEDDPEQALKYTENLSDFFRTILQFKDQELISLKEELILVENYFFLLKKRYGNNLYLDLKIDNTLQKSYIPPMTMQILIENAVKHNIISTEKPLKIRIYEVDQKIIVENNLQIKLSAERSTGIGLENVRKRYRLITDKEIIIKKSDEVFRVELPVIGQKLQDHLMTTL